MLLYALTNFTRADVRQPFPDKQPLGGGTVFAQRLIEQHAFFKRHIRIDAQHLARGKRAHVSGRRVELIGQAR